jgi:hypothetical protein
LEEFIKCFRLKTIGERVEDVGNIQREFRHQAKCFLILVAEQRPARFLDLLVEGLVGFPPVERIFRAIQRCPNLGVA